MDYRLRHDRAKLVKKYRENPRLFPDGIDTAFDRWYGDGEAWGQTDVELWSSDVWFEERMREGVSPVTRASVTKSSVTRDEDIVTHDDKRRLQAAERMRRMRARRLLQAANRKVDDAGG